ncbi:hypothetical protein C8R46DRAFT_1227097 [Mycena filopes]|nr:hypothetical protein C8R46DRAFT_1227097 [Mycena filopes]
MAIVPYKMRGLGFDVNDETAIWHCYSELEAARELALKAPLHSGLRFSLDVTVPQQNPDPRARSIPSGLRPGDSTVCFELVEGLQTGAGKFSQVWTAPGQNHRGTTDISRAQNNSTIDVPLSPSEAWVYEIMKDKQGRIIPYFFGLRTIITPSGESAWVLILEHISGRTLTAVAEGPSISDLQQASKLSIAAIHEFTLVGLIPPDIRGPNFIFTGDAVVIIDFAWTIPIQDPATIAEIADNQQLLLFSEMMQTAGRLWPELWTWAEHNLPEHIWRRN